MSRLSSEKEWDGHVGRSLVSAELGVPLSHRPGAAWSQSRAAPGIRVKKRWFPGNDPSGEGMIVGVEDSGDLSGLVIHVLWSVEPVAPGDRSSPGRR